MLRDNLMSKFEFSEAQAQAILELMLYRLTGLEIEIFEKEYTILEKLIKKLEKILSSEKELFKVIKTELKEISDKYGNKRRTEVVKDDNESKIDIEELIVVEEVMITISKDGFIKRIPLKNYNRSSSNPEDIEYREGDSLKYLINSNTKDTVLIFTDKGFMYQTKGINIPEMKWKEKGERLDEVIRTLNLDNEKVVGAVSLDNFNPSKAFRFITKHGGIKQSSIDKFKTSYNRLQALKLKDDDELINVSIRELEEESKFLRVKSKLGLEFTLEIQTLENTSRNILPIQLFNFAQEDEVIEVEDTNEIEYFDLSLGITDKNKLKAYGRIKEDSLKVKTNSLKELLMFSNKGYVYKVPVFLIKNVINEEMPVEAFLGKLEKGEKIISLVSITSYDDELGVYTFTKKGMVKKTLLKEFEGDFFKQACYKFKFEDDEVVSVEINKIKLGYLVMITKKGMGIRFPVENVNTMGKVASGVTGMSLRDEDEVIFGKYHSNYISSEGNSITLSTDKSEIVLTSKSKEKSVVKINDIKLQNRAGRGTNIMMIVLDDEIKDVTLS